MNKTTSHSTHSSGGLFHTHARIPDTIHTIHTQALVRSKKLMHADSTLTHDTHTHTQKERCHAKRVQYHKDTQAKHMHSHTHILREPQPPTVTQILFLFISVGAS